MRRRWLLVAVLVALSTGWIAQQGVIAVALARTRALQLDFQVRAREVWSVVSSGPYVSFTRPFVHPPASQFVLFNDATGQPVRAPVPAWPCSDGRIGYPWVAFDCRSADGNFRLYNLHTRRWRSVACDATCQEYSATLSAVGAKWLALYVPPHDPCGDNIHDSCGSSTFAYYNIATGRPRVPRPGPTTIIDLDSPALTRPICRPLEAQANPTNASAFPPLGFYGPFALAQEAGGVYLERCGSPLHMPLVQGSYAGQFAGNDEAVAYCPDDGSQPTGISLPGLRRFTFNLPPGMDRCWAAVLGPRHLYVLDTQQNVLWVAALRTPNS